MNCNRIWIHTLKTIKHSHIKWIGPTDLASILTFFIQLKLVIFTYSVKTIKSIQHWLTIPLKVKANKRSIKHIWDTTRNWKHKTRSARSGDIGVRSSDQQFNIKIMIWKGKRIKKNCKSMAGQKLNLSLSYRKHPSCDTLHITSEIRPYPFNAELNSTKINTR